MLWGRGRRRRKWRKWRWKENGKLKEIERKRDRERERERERGGTERSEGGRETSLSLSLFFSREDVSSLRFFDFFFFPSSVFLVSVNALLFRPLCCFTSSFLFETLLRAASASTGSSCPLFLRLFFLCEGLAECSSFFFPVRTERGVPALLEEGKKQKRRRISSSEELGKKVKREQERAGKKKNLF